MKKLIVFTMLIFLAGCATIDKEKIEKERIQQESIEKAEKDRIEKERLDRVEKDRIEKDKMDSLQAENEKLKKDIDQLKAEKSKEIKNITEEKLSLENTKKELEESLKKEIGEYQAKLEITSRGLVVTFVSEVFFASGKGELKSDGKKALLKVTDALKNVQNSNIGIEGHTDNDPIKLSGWKSNWELSSARALAVLHYLVKECKMDPYKLSAIGYGEYRPVALNDNPENKQKNRRVEIIIMPSKITREKQ